MTGMRLRALVVDDEPLARRTLCELLDRERDVELVGVSGDGPSATEAVRAGRPDLLFLDVPAVVFVTAFGEHAVRAFDEEATDYLVKPFDDDRCARALDRARARIEA